ncbi:DUF6265 family protein [Hyphococcus sp.]|jgi:hypothetical protein|uniref:DUF6265 family protein n=1 Tax=Hyphococcus sp. TaxID=2038636 RepID=UPI003D0CF91D
MLILVKQTGTSMDILKLRLTLAILAPAFFAFMAGAARAEAPGSLADLAFLEGHWRGGEDFIFEETWTAADGGVMTGMARGVSSGELKVLEYIVVSEEEDALVMRFKHFNRDYSTWEDGGPVTLLLTDAKENDVTFTADPPSETVKSIRYWMPDEATLQADIVLVENGEEGGFTLVFERTD